MVQATEVEKEIQGGPEGAQEEVAASEEAQTERATEVEPQEEPDHSLRFQEMLEDEHLKPFIVDRDEGIRGEARAQFQQEMGPIYETFKQTVNGVRENAEHSSNVIMSVGTALLKSLQDGTISQEDAPRFFSKGFADAIRENTALQKWLREHDIETAVRSQLEPRQYELHYGGYDKAVRDIFGAAGRPDLFEKYVKAVNEAGDGRGGVPLDARQKSLKQFTEAIKEIGRKEGLKMRGAANSEEEKIAARTGQGSDSGRGAAKGGGGKMTAEEYSQWLLDHPRATAREIDEINKDYRVQ